MAKNSSFNNSFKNSGNNSQTASLSPTKSSLAPSLILSWKDLFGLAATVFCTYQARHISHLETCLHGQDARIAELERFVLQHSVSLALPTLTTEAVLNNNTNNISLMKNDDAEEVEEYEHAPHSHYAIDMINGEPVNPEREYSMADFESIFHVYPLWEVEETEEASLFLHQNNVWEEQYYRDNFDDIAPLAAKAAHFFESLKHEDNNKIYVKWESKETGFGLYAREPFKKGDIVGLYTGVLYADWSHLNQDIDTDYTWDYPSETGNYPHGISFGVDGRERGNYLRFANHIGEESNTKSFFMPYNNRWNVFYVAVKDIEAGAAITSDYGSDYFDDRPLH